MPSVAVVGSGLCGLTAAAGLTERGARVTLVERLPAPGGQEPERPLAAQLAKDARSAGAEFVLATLAVRWHEGQLWTLGVNGATTYRADALLLATGTRVATRGELGITGDRCAGIFPASAAVHLAEAGVLVGERPLIVGGAGIALHCASVLRRCGAREITVIAPDGLEAATESTDIRVFPRWSVTAVQGDGRVAAVSVARDGEHALIAADALILAHRRVPMRNVEGAVRDRRGVVPCYSTSDPKRAEEAFEQGRKAVEQTLALASTTPEAH